MEKAGTHYFNRAIKVNTNSNGANQHHKLIEQPPRWTQYRSCNDRKNIKPESNWEASDEPKFKNLLTLSQTCQYPERQRLRKYSRFKETSDT